jgi:hypothetical protein
MYIFEPRSLISIKVLFITIGTTDSPEARSKKQEIRAVTTSRDIDRGKKYGNLEHYILTYFASENKPM